MKKILSLSLFLIGFSTVTNVTADCNSCTQALIGGDATGQTFFYARPQFQDAMAEKISLFRNDRALASDCGYGAIQITPFGSRTTNKDSHRLARYFMFEQKNQLRVANGAVPNVDVNQGVNLDLNPSNFNIIYVAGENLAPYQSTLCFNPRQSVAGVGFNYIQYFGWGDCCQRKWWGEISFPILHIHNTMGLKETNLVLPQGATLIRGSAPTLTAAFTGQFGFINGQLFVPWKFGKIDQCKKLQKTGIADIEFKIGYEYVRNECAYLYSYIGVLAPTGTRPTAEYVFEPIIGENHHVGFLAGGSGGYEIWSGCDKSLWFDCDIAWRYLFNNCQLRSFDLYNRPWSRYLPVFLDLNIAATGQLTSGINIFTQAMKVSPGVQFDVNWAFVFETECGFQAEVGYNFWARTAERVSLIKPWQVGPSIADVPLNVPPLDNIINRISDIGSTFNGAAVNLAATPVQPNTLYLIQACDINLNSAASPAALTQTVYGTLGYNWDWCWPLMISVGGSYEWSKINTALTRWTAWGKFGISI